MTLKDSRAKAVVEKNMIENY